MFEKAGEAGWKALVPIYNWLVWLKLIGKPSWWLVLLLIPVVNILVLVSMVIDLARAYGQHDLKHHAAALLLPFYWFPKAGFDPKVQYVGPPSEQKNLPAKSAWRVGRCHLIYRSRCPDHQDILCGGVHDSHQLYGAHVDGGRLLVCQQVSLRLAHADELLPRFHLCTTKSRLGTLIPSASREYSCLLPHPGIGAERPLVFAILLMISTTWETGPVDPVSMKKTTSSVVLYCLEICLRSRRADLYQRHNENPELMQFRYKWEEEILSGGADLENQRRSIRSQKWRDWFPSLRCPPHRRTDDR